MTKEEIWISKYNLFETTYIIPFIIVKEVVRLAIGNRREMRHGESNEVNHRQEL